MPNKDVLPNAGVLLKPNAGVDGVVLPKTGVEPPNAGLPKTGVLLPNAGVEAPKAGAVGVWVGVEPNTGVEDPKAGVELPNSPPLDAPPNAGLDPKRLPPPNIELQEMPEILGNPSPKREKDRAILPGGSWSLRREQSSARSEGRGGSRGRRRRPKERHAYKP
ncbi:hypothetical protein SELMODRAFT_417691 [Selaginella moellendorffii]|uniref:Uncharacterized protein n=1 Tax=Selaginella moellendorffii TaxID=88036 RepID=D8S3A1_SELML|nr:hypothetical protein SELMODRAFT_417691 [Selaginella moellendorffii]